MRFCRACGRSLDEHDVIEYGAALPPRIAGWRAGSPVYADAVVSRRKVYTCRVRLIATSPTTGRSYEVADPTRMLPLDTRFVHEDRAQELLA